MRSWGHGQSQCRVPQEGHPPIQAPCCGPCSHLAIEGLVALTDLLPLPVAAGGDELQDGLLVATWKDTGQSPHQSLPTSRKTSKDVPACWALGEGSECTGGPVLHLTSQETRPTIIMPTPGTHRNPSWLCREPQHPGPHRSQGNHGQSRGTEHPAGKGG